MGENISTRVRERRRELRIKANVLAKSVGISAAYLCQLEAGKRTNPSRELVEKLAVALSVTPDLLLGLERSAAPSPLIGNSRNQEAPADPVAGTVACRYPADCDLPAQITALREDLDEIKSQMRTLLGLLGPPMREGLEKRKAG